LIQECVENYEDYIKNVLIQCPSCQAKKLIKIPIKIINQSKQLTTVSIPLDLICGHSFQAFIDKNFKVRAYQKVDFELSKIEFFEEIIESSETKEILKTNFKSLKCSQEIINILRNTVDNDQVLGSSLFTVDGRVLYSSLSLETLFNTIREFETRNEKNLIMVEKYFLVLENGQKIFSEFIQINKISLIVVLIFSKSVRLGMGDLILKGVIKKIHYLNLNTN